jgi:hypothetical protein
VKQRELALARDLSMGAYQTVREQRTLEVLQGQVGLLNAAEALEKQAERIQEWPFAEATFARVVTIASSAVATIIAASCSIPSACRAGQPPARFAAAPGDTTPVGWRHHAAAARARPGEAAVSGDQAIDVPCHRAGSKPRISNADGDTSTAR